MQAKIIYCARKLGLRLSYTGSGQARKVSGNVLLLEKGDGYTGMFIHEYSSNWILIKCAFFFRYVIL